MPDNIKENLDIRPVKWIDEVLAIALEKSPEPLSDEDYLEGSLGSCRARWRDGLEGAIAPIPLI